jgi:tRNA modification GTPase
MQAVANLPTVAGKAGRAAGTSPPAAAARIAPIAALLTATGRGAIAVVRVAGGGSVVLADRVFRPNRGLGLAETARGRIRFGRVGEGLGDEVVAVVLDEPVETVELQCHGGRAAADMVLAALEKAGARRCDPELFVAIWGGDPVAAEATLDLACAPTLRTAEILLEQADGAFARELAALIGLVERGAARAALRCLDDLIARSTYGLRLLTGWRVAIAGRPNVGKSRLLNALAGFTRAIVDPTPGTTRDVVTISIALEGWPVELSDTAGLRAAVDPIEAEGIARAHRELREADLVLVVLDRSEPLQAVDLELVESACRAIVVLNKADLPAVWQPGDVDAGPKPVMTVSAERGDGISDLCAAIARVLVPTAREPGAGVPFRPRHLEALERARECLDAGDWSKAKMLLASLARGN